MKRLTLLLKNQNEAEECVKYLRKKYPQIGILGALSKPGRPKSKMIQIAKDLIIDLLQDGSQSTRKLKKHALKEGVPLTALNKAKKELKLAYNIKGHEWFATLRK